MFVDGVEDRPGDAATLALALYAATIPFQRLFQFDGAGSPATIAGLLVVVLGGIAVLNSTRPPAFHPSVVAAGLLTVIIVLNLGYASLPTAALHSRVRGLAAADASKVIQLLIVLGFMWVVLTSTKRAARVAAGYVIGGHIAVLGNIVDWARTGFDDVRIAGSEAARPNVVAISLALGVPLAWFALNELSNRPTKLVMAAYLASAPVGVLLTGSRTGGATLLFALLVVLFTFRLIPVSARATVLVVVAIALAFLPSIIQGGQVERTVSALTSDDARELDVRTGYFAIAWDEITKNPITGSGRGIVREERSLLDGDARLSSHNSFLNIGSEYGLPALGLYITMWVLAGVTALRSKGLTRVTALVALAVVVGGSMVVNFDLEKANWFGLGIVLVMTRAATPSLESASEQVPEQAEAGIAG